MNEEDLRGLIQADTWMMDVLRAAETLNLPNWWIGAGFLRNKVWDALENVTSVPTRDVDLVYFDSVNNKDEIDWAYDEKMKQEYPFAQWEVRNQARMHYYNNSNPYSSTEDGISHWVETATCVTAKLDKGQLEFLFCHGTDDLFSLVARPIPFFQTKERIQTFYDRIDKKQWKNRWPSLKVVDN